MRLKWNILNGIKLFEWIVHCFRVEFFPKTLFLRRYVFLIFSADAGKRLKHWLLSWDGLCLYCLRFMEFCTIYLGVWICLITVNVREHHLHFRANTILIEIVCESCCEFWTDFLKGMNKIPCGRFWMNRFLKTFLKCILKSQVVFWIFRKPYFENKYVFLIFQSLQEKVEALATV